MRLYDKTISKRHITVDYFRFLKEQQERNKLKKEKRLKAQEERKLEEKKKLEGEKQVTKKITKILTFVIQITVSAFLVLMIVYYIF